jgi:hypothetical protein
LQYLSSFRFDGNQQSLDPSIGLQKLLTREQTVEYNRHEELMTQ